MLKVANSVINASRITGTLPVANGGTGVTTSTGTGNTVLSASPTFSGTAVFAALGGGTSGTGYSFSGSAPATSLTLDSSGNTRSGTADASGTSGVGVAINPTANGVRAVSAASTGAAETYSMYSTGASAYRFYVDWGGTISATSIVITAISDQRLKENVRDIDTGLGAIMALKPRRFDWKEGKGQDKKNAAGFIAQEFEKVFPECVSISKAGEDGIQYKNINHETLIPTLVKAIQELSAKFEAYKLTHP
jgi:hypothetical protein